MHNNDYLPLGISWKWTYDNEGKGGIEGARESHRLVISVVDSDEALWLS